MRNTNGVFGKYQMHHDTVCLTVKRADFVWHFAELNLNWAESAPGFNPQFWPPWFTTKYFAQTNATQRCLLWNILRKWGKILYLDISVLSQEAVMVLSFYNLSVWKLSCNIGVSIDLQRVYLFSVFNRSQSYQYNWSMISFDMIIGQTTHARVLLKA